jgi:hypothetical protein
MTIKVPPPSADEADTLVFVLERARAQFGWKSGGLVGYVGDPARGLGRGRPRAGGKPDREQILGAAVPLGIREHLNRAARRCFRCQRSVPAMLEAKSS